MFNFLKGVIKEIEIINTLISVVVGGLVTYGITVIRDKRERKVEYEKSIGSNIADSLYAVREIVQKANEIEIYGLEEDLELKRVQANLADHAIYPAIFNDGEALSNFFGLMNQARADHEIYLSYRTSSYLFYITNYLIELMKFIAKIGVVDYHLLGALLVVDIQKWQKDFDKVLVKEINKNKLKLVSKTGFLWEKNKKKVLKDYWDKSLLKELIESDVATFDEVMEYCLLKVGMNK